jgi:hypothetical protein
MEEKTKLEKGLIFLEKYFTRLNLFLLLVFITTFLIIFGSSFPLKFQPFVEKVIENKLWPYVLLVFEIFRREVDKKFAKTDKDKLAKIEAVVLSGKLIDPGYILAIINGRDGELSAEMANQYVESRMKFDNPIR